MTHLSDFSFLQRMVSFGYLYVWFLYRVWTLDKFRCLLPKRFRQGELKSIVTLLILFMIPFQLFYDITSVKIKYEEGFANVLGHVFTKPEIMWTKADKSLVIPTEYSLCIGFSLQTGTLVLLQCFWNYLANSVAKATFMSSKEFMFYIFWTFASFIVFPVLQYNFSRDIYQPTYKEIFPEMIYGIELFIVACLGVVSHFRFKKLLSNSRDTVNGRSITQKIRYFQEINLVLSTVLFGHGTLLTTLSCDGLTSKKYLNIHKFSADFFICNINMCAVITWFCMILIFHPKHNALQNQDDEFDDNNTNKQPINNNSGISSNYARASTLVVGGSQASSEYHYKGSMNPLSKSGTSSQITNCDSAFQFGPLPIPPSDANYRNKNSSIASTAPSIATLVSYHQHSMPNIGSHGKGSCSRASLKASIGDYFNVNIPDENYIPTDGYYQEKTLQQLEVSNKLQPIQPYHAFGQEGTNYPTDVPEEEDYIPPPLSPARKNRDIIQNRPTERRYTHSMMIAACDQDMGEFGVSRPTSSTFDHFQKQQAVNNSMLTSFREMDAQKQLRMSHSTSSLLLPLPFEFGSTQSINNSMEESDKSAFGFFPPPPTCSPPPAPFHNMI